MWFANPEQMSRWILLPEYEQRFFENLHRNYRSRKEKSEWERLRGEGSRGQENRTYLVGQKVNEGEGDLILELLKR